MDKSEAIRMLSKEIEAYRDKTYAELVSMIDSEPVVFELKGSDGEIYCIEILAFWDHKPSGNVRVIGSIDDGGWSAFSPVTDSFIKAPSGEFVGEYVTED